jgi:hypothetical protein
MIKREMIKKPREIEKIKKEIDSTCSMGEMEKIMRRR